MSGIKSETPCPGCVGAMPHDHGQPTARVLKCMPPSQVIMEAADTFQQMGDGSRLRILWLLCHCEECVCDIAAAVDMSPAAVSHHLKTLRLHGLLQSRRVGKEMRYTLADNDRARMLHRLIDAYFQMECPLHCTALIPAGEIARTELTTFEKRSHSASPLRPATPGLDSDDGSRYN